MRITFVVALCLTTLIPQTSSIQIKANENNLHNDGNADELSLASIHNKNESDNWFTDLFGFGGEEEEKDPEKKAAKDAV